MKQNRIEVNLFLILLLVYVLTGCDTFGQKAPEGLPTVVLDTNPATQAASPLRSGGVTASGIVVPAEQVQMTFGLAGMVEAVSVSVGDRVTSGQVLARLQGQENLEAAISTAQFALEQAQQALDDLTQEAETARVQAMKDIVIFAQAVKNAQYALDNFTVPTDQVNLDTVEALDQMKQRLDEARLAFEPYRYRPSDDPTRQDKMEALDKAQSDYNAAVKRLQYEYDLEVAQTELLKAQVDYGILKSGPDPAKVRLADARRVNAQTQLAAAQATLEDLTLIAPFDGTVCQVNIHNGEWVIPGQPILVLADLEVLRIETTDLSERDVPKIEIGQSVTVFIKALNQEVAGYVSEISPLADILGGDVVYKTTIDLDSFPPGLRAGMSVEVQFMLSQ